MGQTMVNFRMDTEMKKEMEKVCENIGISMSSAFKLFAKEVIKEKMIPFLLKEEKGSIDLTMLYNALDILTKQKRRKKSSKK